MESGIRRQNDLACGISGEFVAAVVFRMIGMSFEPDGCDAVAFQLQEKPLPEIRVEDRLFVGLAPVASAPAFEPPL